MHAGDVGRRAAAMLIAVVAGFAALAATASADEADELFDPGRMYVIELGLPQSSIDGLNNNSNAYQPGTFKIASTDGTPQGVGAFSAPVSVEVRLKGNWSWRSLAGKAAFKVRFPESGLFKGLRILTLNNMVSDPSMIHETLSYTAYRRAGVPASRTGYAYVYVNGVDYGIHLNIETMDRIALEKLLGPFDAGVQHLYEGEDGDDVWPDFAWSFEVDEGDPDDRGDLEAFADAAHSSGPQPWAERVAAFADLEEMTKMWAVEKYVGQWDGYSGQEESWTPNNYYLYSDATGRFKMLPWGNDESWELAHRLPFDGRAGKLFDFCIEDQACEAIYRASAAELHAEVPAMNLDQLALASAALLAPWQQLEAKQSTREEHTPAAAAASVDEARTFIAGRQAELAAWLGTPPPTRPAPPGPPAPRPPVQGKLRIDRMILHGGVLFTRLAVPGTGRLQKRVELRTRKGTLRACATRRTVRRAGTVDLRCKLSATVQKRRRTSRLRPQVRIGFAPSSGAHQAIARRIVLPRLKPNP
ncbi:MAG TPA: CotH kinase family protein [Solirubrobacterales bacterium]|nr:CotH kinase family protein [Solirubrobacterales bacterium]